jgi:hypothetical protein
MTSGFLQLESTLGYKLSVKLSLFYLLLFIRKMKQLFDTDK